MIYFLSNNIVTFCINFFKNTIDLAINSIPANQELSEEFYLAASLGTDAELIENLKVAFASLDLPIQ